MVRTVVSRPSGARPGPREVQGPYDRADMTPVPTQPASTGAGSEPGPERERVLDAAARLFPERGWAATTVGHLAEASGVDAARIRRLLGDKAEVFAAMVWRAIIGEHADLQEAFDVLHLEQQAGVDARLEHLAIGVTRMVAPMAHLVPVIAEAVARDATLRGIVQGAELQRVGTTRRLVALLTRGAAARPDAVPEVQMLCSGETYRSMKAFSWSDERYAAWLRQALDLAVNGTSAVLDERA